MYPRDTADTIYNTTINIKKRWLYKISNGKAASDGIIK
jgi:hypothetical protein